MKTRKHGKWIGFAIALAVVLTVVVSAAALPVNDSAANLEALIPRIDTLRDASECGVELEVTDGGAALVCEQKVESYVWYRLERILDDGTTELVREEKATFEADASLPGGTYRLTMLCWLPEDVTFPGILRAQAEFTR